MLLKMLISLNILLTVINLTTSQRCTKIRRVKEFYNDPVTLEYKSKYVTFKELYCCPGYVMSNNQCVSACVPDCPANSRCIGVNKCICNIGYTSTTSIPRDIVCEPQCTAGCQSHSTCTQPENCTCDSGYERRSWNGICETIVEEAELLSDTTIGDEMDALLQPIDLDKCTDSCDCWKESSSDDCFKICGSKESDCLEPQFSRCIEAGKRIEYKGAVAPKIYTCYEHSSIYSPITGGAAQSLRMTIDGLMFAAFMLLCLFEHQDIVGGFILDH